MVARGKGVVGAHLIIEPGTEIGAHARIGNRIAKGGDGKRRGIHNLRAHDGKFVQVAPFDIEEKRCSLADERPAHVGAELRGVIVRRLRSGRDDFKRVPGIKCRSASGQEKLAMEEVRTGLGKDFDATVSQFVVFGRKGILVNADFPNGGFGRESASGETINVNLAAVRTGRGASEGLKLGFQLIRIVGQGLQVFALHDHHSGVVGGIDVHFGGRIGDLYFLLFHFNRETDVQLPHLAGKDLNIFFGEKSEALGCSLEGVAAWSKSREFVEALFIRGGVERRTGSSDQTNGCLCDSRAGRIGHYPGQNAGRLLRV